MSRTIVKSVVNAAARKRIVLHADFDQLERPTGYSVRIISNFDPAGYVNDDDTSEEIEYFLMDPSTADSMVPAYQTASERFKALALPLI